jgi:ribonuclease HI
VIKPIHGSPFFDDSCAKDQRTGAGIVLKNLQGKRDCYYKSLDKCLTCNQAEYSALVVGLEIAKGKGAYYLEIKGDSKLVCKLYLIIKFIVEMSINKNQQNN